MNRRAQIEMTDDEIQTFLATQRKVQVATVGQGSIPHLTTLFFTLLDGRIAFTTYRSSQKVVNLRRNPAMSCLVEDGTEYGELRGVTFSGTGRITDDRDTLMRVALVVAARIAGLPVPQPDAPPDPEFRVAVETSVRKRVAIIMEPDRMVSWDHRKLD